MKPSPMATGRQRRRRVVCGLAAAGLLLGLAVPTHAGELLIRGASSKPDLQFFAGRNEHNRMQIFDSRAGYVIRDFGATIRRFPASCRRSQDRQRVTCPHRIRRAGPRRKPAFLRVVAGNRSDIVTVNPRLTLRVLLYGDIGSDRLHGGAAGDTLSGQSHDDYLDGRRGRDTLSGGSGDDVVVSNDDARDIVSCGSGTDRVVGDHLDAIASDCERVDAD
jgi:hypothetical protein